MEIGNKKGACYRYFCVFGCFLVDFGVITLRTNRYLRKYLMQDLINSREMRLKGEKMSNIGNIGHAVSY